MLFGDETADYEAAINRHYAEGAPDGWEDSYISIYATIDAPVRGLRRDVRARAAHQRHPIDTATAHGLSTVDASAFSSFRDLVTGVWLPMSDALNQINRSMGAGDLYPFTIPPRVLEKLDLMAHIVRDAGQAASSQRSVTMDG